MSILHVLEDHEKNTCTWHYISQLSFLLGNAHLSLFDNNNGTRIFRLTLCDINSKHYPL